MSTVEQLNVERQMQSQANYDAKKYICAPWLGGARGGPWTEVFKPAFEEALRTQTDSYGTLHQHIVTETSYGAANGPAHPGGQAGISSAALEHMRNDKGYGLILTHVGHSLNVKEKITTYVANTLTGAPTAAAVAAANAAIAAANANIAAAQAPGGAGAAAAAAIVVPPAAAGAVGVLPDDWLAQLWRWIDANLGQDRSTGLVILNQDNAFDALKITDVGISRETLGDFYAKLIRVNNQRAVPKTLMQLWVKYLSQISFPPLLADKALEQLQTPTFLIVGGPNDGQPDLSALVSSWEQLWYNIYDKGIQIKPQGAPKPIPDRSNRVDGMANTLMPADPVPDGSKVNPSSYANYQWSGVNDNDLHEAYVVSGANNVAFAFLKDERNCWVCKGWGHTKEKCPSVATVKRPISACIQGLEALRAAESTRFNTFRRGRSISRRPGPSPGRRPSAREALMVTESEPLVQYDDGGIYTPDGVEVVPPLDASVPATPEITGTTQAATAVALPSSDPPTQVEAAAVESHAKTTLDASPPTVNHQTLEATIAKDFSSTFGFSAETHACNDCDDDFEYTMPKKGHSIALGMAVAAMALLGAGAMAIRSTKGRALFTLLTVAGFQQAKSAHVEPQTRVHASEFSRGWSHTTAFDLPAGSELNGLHLHKPRQHGTMDTGTTECTSGRRKLFPDNLIEEWNPNLKVEVASGVCLNVTFRGSMAFKVRPYGTTSAKKLITIAVPHSLYVPKMPVTLISTKALFKYNGIRTYFNDELYMLLPDGQEVYFVETCTNYTLLFADDDESVRATRTPVRQKAVHENRLTLRHPEHLTWDLCHERCCHFNPERINASIDYVTGLDIQSLGTPSRHKAPCISCVRGSFRGHRHGHRPRDKYVRFAQRIYSDSCAMPKSTPFGYVEMYIFYDACTKYIAVYFGKTTQAWEMLLAFKTFIADHKRWMPKGHVEEWYADGGPEFKTRDPEEFCAEMHTRRKFIVPWNPWMNVAETGWRIILRPLRIVLAASNVGKGLWPFAVNQIVLVHNALSSSSDTSHVSDESSLAVAFLNSVLRRAPQPSPYFNVTGERFDLSRLRCLFCEVEVRVRNKDDLRKMDKLDPVTNTAIYLGISVRHSNQAMVYFIAKSRFTVASYNDCVFREHVRPRLERMIGVIDMPGYVTTLPSESQQAADTGGAQPPELELPVRPTDVAPATGGNNGGADNGGARNARHGDDRAWRLNHCSHPLCEFDDGHDGPHSHELDAAAQPRRHGLTNRDRTRPTAHLVAAVEGDLTGSLTCECVHQSYPILLAGDEPYEVVIGYNVNAPDCTDAVPTSTKDALSGPFADEWLDAYQKDLAAKMKNGTFTLVPRPAHKRVIKTKVAHAHKHDNPTNSTAITERRARWVGMGFLQGIGDFNATYCATPSACSLRTFLALVVSLNLTLAQGDVTKAFTLNPIDVELFVEQMPGMEVAGDWKGATIHNTVCLLHKCLEGLKQAGNVWQVTHSQFIDKSQLVKHSCTIYQSEVEPTLFIGHCSSGIIAILVWVDDVIVGFSNTGMYEEFVAMYSRRFPSKHHLGCTKFAGVSIEHKEGRMIVHQRPHIEHAFAKFIDDKQEALKSPAASRPAVSDKNSPLHYSKITLAANDGERERMKKHPYLAALATFMYIVHFTLPHFAFHASYLGQFMHDPSPAAWDAISALIVYTYCHRDTDIIMYGGKPYVPRAVPECNLKEFLSSFGFHSYCDASWLLRSPGGFVVMLANGPIDWGSKIIRVICHSSAEAEIAAGCMLGKRVVFITQLLGEFRVRINSPPIILIDNTAADDLTAKFGVTPKTAHFLRWQHYLRWLVRHRYVQLVFVPTKEQLADILTKVVDFSTFLAACRILFKGRSLQYKSS